MEHEAIPTAWETEVDTIRNDHVHGASWLARRAAQALIRRSTESLQMALTSDEGETAANWRIAQLRSFARALAHARPSMAAIANTVAHIWYVSLHNQTAQLSASLVSQATAIALLEQVIAEAEKVRAGWEEVAAHLATQAQSYIPDSVFTLSRSGSVEMALTRAARSRREHRRLRVIIAESQPGGEGASLAAALARAGADIVLIPDTAIGMLMKTAQVFMVGADSVRADGSVINKVGTYPAALVAREASVPAYVLCERLKITSPSYPLILEEASVEEIQQAHTETAPDGRVERRAPWFDVTAASLISSVITETGVASSSDIAGEAQRAESAFRFLTESQA